MNIAFIGYGNMAQAIMAGLGTPEKHQLFAASPSLQPGFRNHICFHRDNLAVIDGADVIILAVKPAKVADVLTEIGHKIPQKTVLLSIAAGLSLNTLQSFCKTSQAIVRCMPNTPLAVGKGAIPMIANQHLNKIQKKRVERIFKHAGMMTWLNDESLMDAFTALSGSGPAYVFLFIEAITAGAVNLGLTPALAEAFALQTASGAIRLLEETGLSPSELRAKVTSPAGTTAAALAVLQQEGFEELLSKAMLAAASRAKELGAEKAKQ